MAKNYASRNIRGKLRVCHYLSDATELRRYVPKTLAFNRLNLEWMIGSYATVYVKPDVGSLGIGICRVRRVGKGYELKAVEGKQQWKAIFDSKAELYNRILGLKRGQMIIQQGIDLDKVGNRPYDIRVMVQRKPGGSWVCTGFMVKVGAAKKIVTNYYQGGDIISLHDLHNSLDLKPEEQTRRERQLSDTAVRIARHLSSKRSGMQEMGIDFAYDTSGELWVLEVNSNHPQFHPLEKIDQEAYNKMLLYAASYGRYEAK